MESDNIGSEEKMEESASISEVSVNGMEAEMNVQGNNTSETKEKAIGSGAGAGELKEKVNGTDTSARIQEIKANAEIDDETYEQLAELFKVFGDSNRAKILKCLISKEMNVSEIASSLDMSISAVSHQLRILRSARLVKGHKNGKEVKYSLDCRHVESIIECGLLHIIEEG